MIKFAKEKNLSNQNLAATADVVDNHLILSLPNALEPIIWRMELEKIGTATFEIKKSDKNETFSLVLKPKKGASESIANFDNKEEALNALIRTSAALQSQSNSGHTPNKMQPYSSADSNFSPLQFTQKPITKNRKWIYLLLGFFAVIALYIYLGNQMPERIKNFDTTSSTQNSSSALSSSDSVGVPLSADDYFKGM